MKMEKIKSLLSVLLVFAAGALFVWFVTAPIEPEDYTPEERITFLEEEVHRCKDANKSLGAVVDALKNATPTPEPTITWPTPYPDDMQATNISEEGCEENRYYDGIVSEKFEGWWNEETEEYAENYELLNFLEIAVSNTVASHNCSKYDLTFDESHFYWSQISYLMLDIFWERFYDEKYLAPDD